MRAGEWWVRGDLAVGGPRWGMLRLVCVVVVALLVAAHARELEVRLRADVAVHDIQNQVGAPLVPVGGGWFLLGGVGEVDWLSDVLMFVETRGRAGKLTKQLVDTAARALDNSEATDVLRVEFVVLGGRTAAVLRAVDGLIIDSTVTDYDVSVTLEARHIRELTDRLEADSNVLWASLNTPKVLMNNFASVSLQSGEASVVASENTPAWVNGITGSNVLVAIADTGIDLDNCYFRSTDDAVETLVDQCDFSQRKIACYYKVANGDAEDGHGHGTHVAATALGLHYRTSPSGNPSFHNLVTDSRFRNGVAPAAKLVFQDLSSSNNGHILTPSLYDIFGQAYGAYARIHSNSWGCGSSRPRAECNTYDYQARLVDAFMWEHKDFLVLFAAGNQGGYPHADGEFRDGFYTVVAPGTAKNALTVGAVGTSDTSQNCQPSCSNDNLFRASSRGFTLDGRVKPEVVAPGDAIVSALSSRDSDDFTFAKKCSEAVFESGLQASSGTSMAAPAIAGAAALVRQYYTEYNPVTGERAEGAGPLRDGMGPSAALVKATLIAASRDLTGLYYARGEWRSFSTASREDRRRLHGWGLPVVSRVLNFDGKRSLFVSDRRELSKQRQDVYRFSAPGKPANNLRVVLTYSDYPGAVHVGEFDASPVIVNNLDLRVKRCGSGGCDLAQSTSAVDVVEVVDIGLDRGHATLEVTVRAENVNVDAQHYALVVACSEAGLELIDGPADNFSPQWEPVPRNISGVADTFENSWGRAAFDAAQLSVTAAVGLSGVLVVMGGMFVGYVQAVKRWGRPQTGYASEVGITVPAI